MPRKKRYILPAQFGVMHIYSKAVGGEFLFGDREKEAFLVLLEHLASVFFVKLHDFVIMSNHFHLILSEDSDKAQAASETELLDRYQRLIGRQADPPIGRQLPNGQFIPDADNGMERLRQRLESVSAFVQTLKQGFSLRYNKEHDRKGYLWGERFGCQLAERGDAALAVGAYTSLNPVRAHLVDIPDDYRWCGLGLLARAPERARAMLSPFPVHPDQIEFDEAAYRMYVYRSGTREVEGKHSIDPAVSAQVEAMRGRLGFMDLAAMRIRYFSESLALGSETFIAEIQKKMERKFIRPRRLQEGVELFCNRMLS